MRLFISLFGFFSLSSMSFGALVSEFQPNPDGSDPATQTVEFFGTPGSAVTGFLSSIDTDNFIGTIDRQTALSGVYDANGIFTVDIDDLENPSFALVYSSADAGGIGVDLDSDGDGSLDDPSLFGTVFDAVSIADSEGDAMVMYGSQLGGIDLAFSGSEPELAFRAGSNGNWFVVNELGNDTTIFDAAGNNISASAFDIDPSTGPTFGSINPVPEPNSILLSSLALAGVLFRRRSR